MRIGEEDSDLLTHADLAEIYEQSVRALLKSYPAEAGIEEKDLAALLNIDARSLYRFVAGSRHPTVALANHAWEARGVPDELRGHLSNYAQEAVTHRRKRDEALEYERKHKPLAELAAQLEEEYRQIGGGRMEPARARRLHEDLLWKSHQLANDLGNAVDDAGAYVRLCVIDVDVSCILGRLYDALPVAGFAVDVALSTDGSDCRSTIAELHDLQVDAIRHMGILYHNLGLDRQAMQEYARAEQRIARREARDHWRIHLVRDQLKAMPGAGPYRIRDVEGMAREAKRVVRDPVGGEVLSLLLDLGLDACWVHYPDPGKLKDAGLLLDTYRHGVDADSIPQANPLHRVLYYHQAMALEERKRSELEKRLKGSMPPSPEFIEALRRAVGIAGRAGLWTELRKIGLRYPELAREAAAQEGVSLYRDPSSLLALRLGHGPSHHH